MAIDRRALIGSGLALAALPAELARAAYRRDPVMNSIALEDGRVWIAATIKAKPYLFVVDTGAFVSFIDDGFAKSIGLQPVPGMQIRGVGGVSDKSWYNAGDVALASGIHFPDMLFAGIRGRPSPDAVGTLGAGLFTTYDSDLDFEKGQWRAYPDGRPNFDGLVKLKSRFTKGVGGASIVAEASIDGFTGDFLLDTGAPNNLSINGRAAKRSGLWDDSKPYAPAMSRGIGAGAIPARIVRSRRIMIGPFAFDGHLVKLDQPGSIGSEQDGLIGLHLLGQLQLSTDVSGGVLYAKENGRLAAQEAYPLSGLWLEERKDRVVIGDVGTGSPAARAGLQKGEMLVGGDLSAMIRTINGNAGKTVVLNVDRGGVQREVRYTLAPWL